MSTNRWRPQFFSRFNWPIPSGPFTNKFYLPLPTGSLCTELLVNFKKVNYLFIRPIFTLSDAEQNLQATNLWGANHNAIESSILATLSQLVQLKSKDKYFGGENVSIADIEIFTHFQLLSDSGREKLLEKSPPQFQKWHNRMLKFFENQ